jgi:hypothetical protein
MSVNIAAFIACQVVPVMTWGLTGVGKSATWEAMADALGRTFVPLLGATHLPEDFSGYPTPDVKAGVVRMMPTTWVHKTRDGKALVLIDEATNVPSATQAGLLSVITERRVGDEQMPASTIIVAAANPPHLCPNAVPLSPAMRSRFYHHDWQVDYDHWFAGLRAGCVWTAPTFPIVPDTWTDLLPQFGTLAEAFLRAAPDCREQMPVDDETMSFPTPRTWTYLVRCFAAASACGYGMRDGIYKTLAFGCVGQPVGSEFIRYMHQLDLLDPEAVIAGTKKYTYENRPDANICLLTGLVRALRSNCTPERWLAAAEVFIEIGNHEIESMLMQFRTFWKSQKDGGVRPDGWAPPAEVMQKIASLVQQ